MPIIIYNNAKRTGVNIDPDTIQTLAESRQFAAIKQCGDLHQLWAFADHPACKILCGDDACLYTALAHGGQGAVSAAANIHAELFVAVYKFMQERKFEAARVAFNLLKHLIHVLFSEPNPAPIKAALAMKGWLRDELRLPMLPASDACRTRLRAVIGALENAEPCAVKEKISL